MSSVHDISNIIVNNNNITVEFKKGLKQGQIKKQDFIVHKNDIAVDISQVSISSGKLSIDISGTISLGELKFMYNKDKNDPIKHLRDVSGLRLTSFGYPPSQFKPIITEVSTMVLNGQDDKQLIVTLNTDIKNNVNLVENDFTVHQKNVQNTVLVAEASNNKLLINLQNSVTDIDAILLKYDLNKDLSGSILTDNDKYVSSFIHPKDLKLTNMKSVRGNIHLEFSNKLKNNANIKKQDFKIKINGQAKNIENVKIENGRLILRSDERIDSLENVEIEYVQDISENTLIKNESELVMNSFTKDSIEFKKSTSKATKAEIIGSNSVLLTFNKFLKSSGQLQTDDFEVKYDNSGTNITSVDLSNGKVRIVTDTTMTDLDKLMIKYNTNNRDVNRLKDMQDGIVGDVSFPDRLSIDEMTIDGTQVKKLKIKMNKKLDSTTISNFSDYKFVVDGSVNTIQSMTVSVDGELHVIGDISMNDIEKVSFEYIESNDPSKQIKSRDGVFLNSFLRSGYHFKTNIEKADIDNAGMDEDELEDRLNVILPNVKKDVYNLTDINNGIKAVTNDTEAKRAKRNKLFAKKVMQRVKSIDTSHDLSGGKIRVLKTLMAFPNAINNRIKDTVVLYDASSNIKVRDISQGETVYVPLMVGESCIFDLSGIEYTFKQISEDSVNISPPLQGNVDVSVNKIIESTDYTVMIGSVAVNAPDAYALIHIPVLFNIEGNTTVVGEKFTETGFYSYRHIFTAGGSGSPLTAELMRDNYFYKDEVQRFEVGLNGNDFTINGVTKPILQLGKLTRYVFDLSDPSLNGVGFGISTTEQGISGEDVSGQTLISIPGNSGSKLEFFVPNDISNVYYYAKDDNQNYNGNKIEAAGTIPLFARGPSNNNINVENALHNILCQEGIANVKQVANSVDSNSQKLKTAGNIDYDDIITGDTGHSIGEVLLRYVATHLTGHPLGQAIIRNDQDFKQQVDNQTQNSKIANTLLTNLNADMVQNGNTAVRNEVLQSIFEQMVALDVTRFQNIDDSSFNSLPFRPNDDLLIYIKLRANLFVDSDVNSVAGGNAAKSLLNKVFPASAYPYMNTDGLLDAGVWQIRLRLS